MRATFALALITLAAAQPALAASPEDPKINAVYAGLARARAAGDIPGMAAAFAGEGLLIDSRPGPAISGAELPARLQPMTARLTAEQVKVSTAYRIERRSVSGDLALDAGFMRQTMTRPNGQEGTRYARFLVTMRKDAAGQWRIVGDASMPVPQAMFDGAKPVEGLHFDG